MKYPKEYLDEIKLRLKVSQVVGKSVQLKKRGKEFVGLSPFKNEKSPSFTVNDEKEFYHCFSSSEHGNIFDFLMKTKSIGFGEAVDEVTLPSGFEISTVKMKLIPASPAGSTTIVALLPTTSCVKTTMPSQLTP